MPDLIGEADMRVGYLLLFGVALVGFGTLRSEPFGLLTWGMYALGASIGFMVAKW